MKISRRKYARETFVFGFAWSRYPAHGYAVLNLGWFAFDFAWKHGEA